MVTLKAEIAQCQAKYFAYSNNKLLSVTLTQILLPGEPQSSTSQFPAKCYHYKNPCMISIIDSIILSTCSLQRSHHQSNFSLGAPNEAWRQHLQQPDQHTINELFGNKGVNYFRGFLIIYCTVHINIPSCKAPPGMMAPCVIHADAKQPQSRIHTVKRLHTNIPLLEPSSTPRVTTPE